ncbi:GNAT family N-acetyltransferase [Actinomyces vulturis]|uniref:GNAT family N-acetyltransferase n=1 Tax=Actinomyces vulturis TaxID=1857645 RepID=UPI00082EEA71|nr:GNAT family N-acetyltransferase [Actinomyces vulturis]
MTCDIRIVPAREQDADPITELMADVFLHDPTMKLMVEHFPTERRRNMMAGFLSLQLRDDYLPGGLVDVAWLVEDGQRTLAGSAWWIEMDPRFEHPGCEDRAVRVLGDGAALWNRCEELAAPFHPQCPHHYLYLLAVNPDCRSMSVGSKLLEHGIDRAHQRNMPAFLEATTTRAAALYERMGMRSVGLIEASDPLPECYPMCTQVS